MRVQLQAQGLSNAVNLDDVDDHEDRLALVALLRVVPRKYQQTATSIETLLDLKTMSIEELNGRLLAVEDNSALDNDDHSGRLLLTAEEWEARRKATRGNGASGSGG